MEDAKKRAWAEIYLGNLRHNMQAIRASLPEGTKFLGVVKANAYGHGAVPAAKELEANGADYLAVACIDEAIELRENGLKLPILILGYTPPEYTKELCAYSITQAVSSEETAEAYSREAAALGQTLRIHIKADTGMTRTGFTVSGAHFEEGVAAIARVCALPALCPEGIFTHFAVSDEPEKEESRAYTEAQFALFCRSIEALNERGVHFALRHCANTGAVLHYPEMALDMVRPGLLLYGYGDTEGKLGLKPCMGVFSRVAALRDCSEGVSVSYGRRYTTTKQTRLAVITIGYADGLSRRLTNRASFVSEAGVLAQCGTICMDMCMLDATDAPTLRVGSAVEIFGEHNDLQQLAELAETIPYELLCAVSRRIPRVYIP